MFHKAGRAVSLLVFILALGIAPLALSCSGPATPQQGSSGQAPQAAEKKAEAPAKKAGEPVKIRVAWGIPGEEQKYIMQKKPEILKNYGKAYTVEWFQFQGSAPQGQALAAGGVDAGTLAGSSSAQLAAQNAVDFLITGAMIAEYQGKSYGTTWLVKDDSGIKDLKDLKGKTVATNAFGSSLEYIQRDLLKQNGLEAGKDFKVVEVPFGLMEDNLRKGNIDAGPFPQPFFLSAMKKGGVKPIFKLTDVQPKYVQLINVFNKKFVQDHPDAVKAFQEDWKIASEYMQKNPEETKKVVAEITKIPLNVINEYLLTKDDYYHDPIGEPDLDTLQKNWDWMYESGQIKKKMEVKNYYDPKFLPSAVK